MKKNFEIIRGDTLMFTITIEDLEEDLDSCYFSCKKTIDDETYSFQKLLGNGIEKLETGKYKIRVAPEDTKSLDVGRYIYDLQIGINEDIYTIMIGTFNINKEITEQTYERL